MTLSAQTKEDVWLKLEPYLERQIRDSICNIVMDGFKGLSQMTDKELVKEFQKLVGESTKDSNYDLLQQALKEL